jgi:sulfopyruvate decarboxylase subunit beta
VKRLDALRAIDETVGDHPLVITCGATARELASISRRPSHLPLLDSMGLTSALGLGVALGHPGPVTVIDGDGSLLMGLSVLATLACYAPPNLTVVVLDNGQHASADELESQAARIDLAAAAAGFGLAVRRCADVEELTALLAGRPGADAFALVVAAIEPGNAPGIPLLLADPAVLAATFSAALPSA